MQCRMCSQRLTRPGKLCRDCERELQRARATAASVGTLSPAVPLIDTARMSTPDSRGWMERVRSRPTVLVTAFSVGIATAAAVYVVQGSHAASVPGSVMIDRDLGNLRPRASGVAPERAASPGKTMPTSRDVMKTERAAGGLERNAGTPRTPANSSESGKPVMLTVAGNASHPAPAAFDRVLALADALDGCAHETLFARIACEHRARMRYCDGAAGRIQQCLEAPAREYGQ